MPKENVMVLGGRGLIGGHICRRLLKLGYSVHVFSSSDRPLANLSDLSSEDQSRLTMVSGGMNDSETIKRAVGGCRYMVHASIPYPIWTLDWRKRFVGERNALRTVLQGVLDVGVEQCVLVSVSGTIGAPDDVMSKESVRCPSRFTGTSVEMKHVIEEDIYSFVDQGLPAVIVNPTLCIGEYDTRPSTGLFLMRLLSLPFRFLEEEKINIVDVRDVAYGTVSALTNGRVGERYLLGNENTTVAELARRVRNLADGPAPLFQMPRAFLYATCWSSEWWAWLFQRSQPRFPLVGLDLLINGNRHFDTSKARRELGLPQHAMDGAIRRALNWYLDNGHWPQLISKHAKVLGTHTKAT